MMPNNLLTVASFCLPVFLVVYYRLYRHLSIVALVLYCVLKVFQLSIVGVASSIEEIAIGPDVFFDFLELPLLLSALLLFCSAGRQQERMQAAVLLFVFYEIFALLFVGYTPLVGLCVALPGTILVVLHSLFLFQQQLRFTLIHKKNGGRLLILGGILLMGSFRFAGFILETANDTAFHTIYSFVPDLSVLLLSLGLYTVRKRIKDLQELKIARREMQILFGS